MKIKLLYLVILFFVFGYGVIVGHYKVFPFDLLSYNYTLFHKAKLKILYYSNFKKNKKCVNQVNKEIELIHNPTYTFFIAGHTYGSKGDTNLGIYPKFYDELLDKKEIFDFGIFAGDVTRRGNKKSWEVFDNQISKLDYKIYVAPGNHDIGSTDDDLALMNSKKNFFEERYGGSYQSFKFRNDLFIILNPYENEWSIKNKQLEFLKKNLQYNYKFVDNIFIISHPAIFINKKFNIKANGFEGKGKDVNFWEEVYPLFIKFKNNYFIISGDVGANANGYELFCKEFKKNIFLATGMGGRINDNYLIFKKINKKIRISTEVF